MPARVRIDSRFNGPPGIANGGLAAGLIADAIGERVMVRLIQAVPLETDLTVSRASERWEVHAGEALIATATAAAPITQAPPFQLPYAEAVEAAKRYPGLGSPRFAGCFVCGAARPRDDGLRIYAGDLSTPNTVAAPWTPTSDLADGAGNVRPEILWAALDCPGYFAAFQDGRYALLGELAVQFEQSVKPNEPCVIVGWTIAQAGRKRRAGTGLFDASGSCRALGVATWIEVAPRA